MSLCQRRGVAVGPRVRSLAPGPADELPEQPRLELDLLDAACQREQPLVATERVGEVVELQEEDEPVGRVERRLHVDVSGAASGLDRLDQGLAAELPSEVAGQGGEVR